MGESAEPRRVAGAMSFERLNRAARLRVPARLALEFAALSGASLTLRDRAGRVVRLLAGSGVATCDEKLLPGESETRVPCSREGALHFVVAVRARGERVGVIESGPVSLPSDRLELLDSWLGIARREMSAFLEEDEAPAAAPAELAGLVGSSPPLVALRSDLRQALRARYPVLITGESGTGKELVASLLHGSAPGAHGAYVSLNCAALPEALVEGELFGARRGAYTGADRDKPGLVEVAHGGTLFLDELQQLSLAAQAKLLRFAESGEYLPLGAPKALRSDARLVCATNASLESLVAAGSFRRDLYYRLNVLRLHTPALRDIREDIPLLARHFASLIAERAGEPCPTLAPATIAALLAAQWPGNVRQLIHELERGLLKCDGPALLPEHLSPELRQLAPASSGFAAAREQLVSAWEREELGRGLKRVAGNVSRLARELGLSRSWLIAKLVRLGLRKPE